MRFENTSAVVTGGASGLGEATVRALAERGVVCTIFDRDEERAGAVAAEVGQGAGHVAGDVGDEEAVRRAVSRAAAAGELRIVVNCAGIAWAQRTIDREGNPHDLDAFKAVVEVNLVGTFNVMRIAAGEMARCSPLESGERGVIVNTASVAAFEGQIGQISYSASKGGIVSMTVPAARDLAPAGIRVNAIAPGIMDTPMLGLLPDEAREALGAGVLFPKRLGMPEEYARLVLSIVENPYLNGETIRLDGGLRMPPR